MLSAKTTPLQDGQTENVFLHRRNKLLIAVAWVVDVSRVMPTASAQKL